MATKPRGGGRGLSGRATKKITFFAASRNAPSKNTISALDIRHCQNTNGLIDKSLQVIIENMCFYRYYNIFSYVQCTYSVMQAHRNIFCADVDLDSVNMASREEDSISDLNCITLQLFNLLPSSKFYTSQKFKGGRSSTLKERKNYGKKLGSLKRKN